MRFTLPVTSPDGIILPEGYELQWLGDNYLNPEVVEVQFSTPIDGVLASGYGATPADAMCGLLSAFPDSDEVRLPACVAAALDELAHQAVRIVCDRLSGGELVSATESERVTPVFRTGDPSRLVFDIGNAALLPGQFVVGVIVGYEDPDNPAAMRSKVSVEEAIHPRLVAAAFKGVAEHMSALAVEQDVALLDTQAGPVQAPE